MSELFNHRWLRRSAWLGALTLGLAQMGCAHPVAVEPSVVISSRIGHAPIYTHIGVPGPVVVMPPPSVYYAPPPRVIYGPPVVHAPMPGWGHGHGWPVRQGYGWHGHRPGWRH